MPLSTEQVYDELNGEEIKQILLTRVKDLLDSVPDFQRHLTLPRVIMSLKLHLDIYGRRNSALDLINELELRTKEPDSRVQLAEQLEVEDVVNADTGAAVPGSPFQGEGDPPDQIREEHGIPVREPVRDRTVNAHFQRPAPGPVLVDTPVSVPAPGLPRGRRYAAFHVLEREGPAVMGFTDYKPGSEPFTKEPQTLDSLRDKPASKPDVGIQADFREMHRPEKKE